MSTREQNPIWITNYKDIQLYSPKQSLDKNTKKQTIKFIGTSIQNKPAVKAINENEETSMKKKGKKGKQLVKRKISNKTSPATTIERNCSGSILEQKSP